MSNLLFFLHYLTPLACIFVFVAVDAFPLQVSINVIPRRRGQSPGTTFHFSKGQDDTILRRSSENDNNELLPGLQEERFSVAPMMGHTHRHYHYYFRHFSRYATLYTEMVPAAQIVTAFQQQFQIGKSNNGLSLNQVLDLLHSSPNTNSGGALDSLLQMAQVPSTLPTSSSANNNIVLQLGGKDPHLLALASAIGSYYGYDGINLNCGCPSNAVSGGDRSGGAALMREPSLVAQCLEEMSQGLDDASSSTKRRRKPILSVKHRLGVQDAATYDAKADRARSDGDHQAFLQCRDFIKTISLGGEISKIQVHARLGLLGEFDPHAHSLSAAAGLWVPGSSTTKTMNENQKAKVDHKRLQYKAKKTARQATIQNRSVPPLRPNVVVRIATEFPHLQVITNGGIRSMEDVEERVPHSGQSNIMGAMVGRAVINHPCAFGTVDSLWQADTRTPLDRPTREAVLFDYIQYCQKEEETFLETEAANARRPEKLFEALAALRRRLVAVPFHLFAGEVGNEEYQRRIRKLVARAERHTSAGILLAGLEEVPIESASKPVTQYSTEMKDIPIFQSSSRRAGPLQRTIF